MLYALGPVGVSRILSISTCEFRCGGEMPSFRPYAFSSRPLVLWASLYQKSAALLSAALLFTALG
jgi:hypothetical protein